MPVLSCGARRLVFSCLLLATPAAFAQSAIYGGGPFYSGGNTVIDDLRSSGFTTVMLWSIHVNGNGDLNLNDVPLISNGQYVGSNADWSTQLQRLRQAPTSVNRVEVSIGAGGTTDFESIHALVNGTGPGSGTGPDSILYRNFQALKALTGADAANFDDESAYDLPSATAFGQMLVDLGYRITFVPYTNRPFWVALKANLGNSVDRIYLQDYAGGTGNDPKAWSDALGMPVWPGLWSRHGSGCTQGSSPAQVGAQMSTWRQTAGIEGGFMWLYDDILACSAPGQTTSDYAGAINGAVGTR